MKTKTLLKIDLGISFIMLVLVVVSMFSKSFSIFSNLDERVLGMNNFGLILLSINHVLAGIGVILMYKTWVFSTILESYPELEGRILSVYQIKWGVFLLVNILPYAFNHKPPVVFLIFHIFLFLLFIYKRVENGEREG